MRGQLPSVIENDDALLLRAAAGDLDAFGEFFDRHAARILRYFQLRTAASDSARDLCAETFAASLESLSAFDPRRGTGAAWITGIARYKLLNWLRSERINREALERLRISLPASQSDELDLADLRIDLRAQLGELEAALATLGEGTRDAVLLRVIDELPYSEIALRLRCTPGAARVRVSRGLSDLLGHFDDAGGGS